MRQPLISFLGFASVHLFLLAAFGCASQETFTLNLDPSDLVFEKAQGYDRVGLPDCRFPAETDGAECKDYIDSSLLPDYFQATKLCETSGNRQGEKLG
jgi:hypothetical protein